MSTTKTNTSKCAFSAGVATAIDSIKSAMRRKGISLLDMYKAVNILTDCAVEEKIVGMRKSGFSIRKIARAIHMDDSRVSAIIKAKFGNCPACGANRGCDNKRR